MSAISCVAASMQARRESAQRDPQRRRARARRLFFTFLYETRTDGCGDREEDIGQR